MKRQESDGRLGGDSGSGGDGGGDGGDRLWSDVRPCGARPSPPTAQRSYGTARRRLSGCVLSR